MAIKACPNILSALISSKSVKKDKKPKFSKGRIGKIEGEFNELKHKFSKLERKEIRRNLYEIKNKKNLFTLGTAKIENSLDEVDGCPPFRPILSDLHIALHILTSILHIALLSF